MYVYMYVVASE